MTCHENTQRATEPDSIFKPRIYQRIEEIIELGTKDRAAAIKAALRLRKWLAIQNVIGQAELDRQEALKEVEYLIDILRDG